MTRIADLDETARCNVCRHFYHRPKRVAEQLPLRDVAGVGRCCAKCEHDLTSPRWDGVGRGVDPVAFELGEEAA